MPFALLAGALGDELLNPQTERLEALRHEQRQLVATALDAGGHDRAKREAGILARVREPAGAFHRTRAGQEASRSSPISAAGTMPKSESAE